MTITATTTPTGSGEFNQTMGGTGADTENSVSANGTSGPMVDATVRVARADPTSNPTAMGCSTQ